MQNSTGPDDPNRATPDADAGGLLPPASRRTFLAMLGGIAATTAIEGADTAWAAVPEATIKTNLYTMKVTRAADMIDLTLRFRNTTVTEPKPGTVLLAKADGSLPAYMIVEFGPQHVAEEALFMSGETIDPALSIDAATGEIAPTDPDVSGPYSTGNLFVSPVTYQWHRTLPLRSRFASPSRLVFRIDPARGRPIPFTVAGLLDWTNPRFVPSLVPAADLGRVYVSNIPVPLREPVSTQTSIEFPYGLILTPTPEGRWSGRGVPFDAGTNRTEVWGATLADSERGPRYVGAPMRAVWTTEDEFPSHPDPIQPPEASANPGFLTLPTQHQKWQLVRKTTDRALTELGRLPAPTLKARTFRLSSLGATVDLYGEFTGVEGLALETYVHKAFAGRDVFVKVVEAGHLYPTGHRASQVTVAERVFATPSGAGAGTGTVAYLQEYTFLVVREKVRTYSTGPAGENAVTRNFPFRRVAIDLDQSPPMYPQALPDVDGAGIDAGFAFLPIVDGDCFRWPCTVIDKTGEEHRVTIPLAFVSLNYPSADWPTLKMHYDAVTEDMRTIHVNGLRIGFARDDVGGIAGKTSLPTGLIRMFGAPSFSLRLPAMEFAAVQLEAMRGFSGVNDLVAFRFPELFLQLGFTGQNAKGFVFGQFVDDVGFGPLAIEFPDVKNVGGLVRPDFSLTGLSGVLGTFGGEFSVPSELGFNLPDFLTNDGGAFAFDPTTWFSGLPKILGGLDLADLLEVVPSFPTFDVGRPAIPGFTTEVIYGTVAGREVPIGLEISYSWCTTRLSSAPGGDSSASAVFLTTASSQWVAPAPTGSMTTKLCIDVTFRVQLAVPSSPSVPGVEADVSAQAELRDFQVSLFGSGAAQFVVIEFRSLTFSMKSGSQPKVTPSISRVTFGGALNFIRELADRLLPEGGLLGGGGGGGGGGGLAFTPLFDVDSQHVEMGFTLGVPSLSLGAFSLSNLEVGMLVNLPFDSLPMTARFNVCRKDRPFMLSVGFLGGGGFFALEVGLDGVRSLEISLEFGANMQIDLGVASGGVTVVAGIHFVVKSDPDLVELTGYFRLNGRLEIIGLITVSAEFLLSLTYVDPPGVAKGRAEVSFTVEVAFFSATVTAECERTFAGGGGSAPSAAGRVSSGPAALGVVATATDFVGPPPPVPGSAADYMSQSQWSAYVGAFAS
ncbi:MAG: hypothetical protein ACO3AV_06300 [Ilumatobacteraceae bacterium]